MNELLDKWSSYCNHAWDADDKSKFSPEMKVKRFLDGLAYFLMIGDTEGVVTYYKSVMNAKREVPMSSCPTFVEDELFSLRTSLNDDAVKSEKKTFEDIMSRIDERAEKYCTPKKKAYVETRFDKFQRLKAMNCDGKRTRCIVDTEGKFTYNDKSYQIDMVKYPQYACEATKVGDLYDMDRVIVWESPFGTQFYDMNLEEIFC